MGTLVGVDIVVIYEKWSRQWQRDADWLRFRAEGNMTREVISQFLYFFTEPALGPLSLVSAHTAYSDDPLLCETAVLARLISVRGQQVSILITVGEAQPDRQEFPIKGTKASRRITNFHEDVVSDGDDFITLRMPPKDPRATSLTAQLDNLSLYLAARPKRPAKMDEAFRVQPLIKTILK